MNIHTMENHSDIKNKAKLFSRKWLELIGGNRSCYANQYNFKIMSTYFFFHMQNIFKYMYIFVT